MRPSLPRQVLRIQRSLIPWIFRNDFCASRKPAAGQRSAMLWRSLELTQACSPEPDRSGARRKTPSREERARSYGRPRDVRFAPFGDAAHQLRHGLQVPVREIGPAVPEVGRQHQHVLRDVVATVGAVLQRAYRAPEAKTDLAPGKRTSC